MSQKLSITLDDQEFNYVVNTAVALGLRSSDIIRIAINNLPNFK